MDNFKFVDMETWERAEFYKLFTGPWHSIYGNMMKKLEVTELVTVCKEKGVKFAAAVAYCVSNVINSHECFRMGIKDKQPIVWDVVHPTMPVRNRGTGYSYHTVRYEKDFKAFYENYLNDKKQYPDTVGKIFAGELPENFFQLSIIPLIDFDDNSLSIGFKYYFAPMVVIGKYAGDGKKLMPVAITGNHAVVDGYDVANFLNELQQLFSSPWEWLKL